MPTFSYINDVLFIEYLCHRVPEEEGEEEKVRAPPTFVSKPEPVTVEEGDCSRFCCRVTGHPRPRVMWILNGHTVVNVSFNFYSLLQATGFKY